MDDRGFCVVVANGHVGSVSEVMPRTDADRYAMALRASGETGLIVIVDETTGNALKHEGSVFGEPVVETWEAVREAAQSVAQLAMAVLHSVDYRDVKAICADLKILHGKTAAIDRFCAEQKQREKGGERCLITDCPRRQT